MNTYTAPDAHQPNVCTIPRGEITMHGSTYQVNVVQFSAYTDRISGNVIPATEEFQIVGRRGAVYFIRDYMRRNGQPDDGVRQVISWKSGQPMRSKGNEVRVMIVGDIIEEHVKTARG